MKVGEIRRIAREAFGDSGSYRATVFVVGDEIIVRRRGQTFYIQDDAANMEAELAKRGVIGKAKVSWSTRGVRSFQVVDVVIPRKQPQP